MTPLTSQGFPPGSCVQPLLRLLLCLTAFHAVPTALQLVNTSSTSAVLSKQDFSVQTFSTFPHAALLLYKINHFLICAPTCLIYCYSLYHHGSLYYTSTFHCSLLGANTMSYSKLSVPGPLDLFHIKEHIENDNDNIYDVNEASLKD